MEKIKRMIMLQVPTSICNLRCHYCYLAQRPESYQGLQAEMKYSPEYVAEALSPSRLGGICFINSCADGETLLTKNIDKYYKALVEKGHYLEIVTNLTATPMIERILQWNAELLKRIEFKCSFHYLELKKKNLLDVFSQNVNMIWESGASATIEITPSDELIPLIDEVKEYSIRHFGALPHLTIARDDRTEGIVNLTSLSEEEYYNTWKSFNSDLWEYKRSVFGKKQVDFCYAGLWSVSVNIVNGDTSACYYQKMPNIFENIDKPYHFEPIGKCPIAHCYNAHAFLTFGLIPDSTVKTYSEMRNRIRSDGSEWLQPELKAFYNSKLIDSNKQWPKIKEKLFLANKQCERIVYSSKSIVSKAIKKLFS